VGTSDVPVDADAVLVLALWREANGAWRVRVTRSTHRGESGPLPTYAATRADVLRAVEEWFDQAVTPP
jgi:hypothetical protein